MVILTWLGFLGRWIFSIPCYVPARNQYASTLWFIFKIHQTLYMLRDLGKVILRAIGYWTFDLDTCRSGYTVYVYRCKTSELKLTMLTNYHRNRLLSIHRALSTRSYLYPSEKTTFTIPPFCVLTCTYCCMNSKWYQKNESKH